MELFFKILVQLHMLFASSNTVSSLTNIYAADTFEGLEVIYDLYDRQPNNCIREQCKVEDAANGTPM